MSAVRASERIAVAGAGRAGGALAAGLSSAGMDVLLWDRTPTRARRVARRAGAHATSSTKRLTSEREIVLICVDDDAVADVAERLARDLPARGGPRSALHVAGALSAAHLRALADRGLETGVFHPAVSLDGAGSEGRLRGATATISGSERAVRAARRLARRIGMHAVRVDDEARPLVHLAAVLAAGDLVALLGTSERLLAAAGMTARDARRLVTSLASGALEGFERRGAAGALTGPVARGDTARLRAHVAALERSGLPSGTRREAGALHLGAARAGVGLLRSAGRLDARTAARLTRALDSMEKPR